MRETAELSGPLADQLQRLRVRLGRLERRAAGDEELAGQVRRLHALIDHLEHRVETEDEQSILEEQQLIAELRLSRLRRHLDELDAKLAAERDEPQAPPVPAPFPASGSAISAEPVTATHPLVQTVGDVVPDSPTVAVAASQAGERQESRPLSIAISLAALVILAGLTLVLTPIPAHP